SRPAREWDRRRGGAGAGTPGAPPAGVQRDAGSFDSRAFRNVVTVAGMESDQPTVAAGLVAVLLLVLANAFFVAAEFALVGARRTRLDELGRGGDGKARLARRAVQ